MWHRRVMADRRAMDSSIIIEDYFTFPQSLHKEDSLITSTPTKLTNLINTGNEFAWKGSLEGLKIFVQTDLKLQGKWTSPGGEVKLFTSKNYVIKWYGKNKRIVIVKDNKEQSLAGKFKSLATLIEGEFKDHSDEQHVEAEDTLGMDKTVENISTKKSSIPTHATEYQEDVENSEIERNSTKYGCDSGKIINSQCHCSELADQFKRIEGDLKLLKKRIEVREADEAAPICRTVTCRSERNHLKSELDVANAKIIDLQTKVKHLENEKSSLTTAIRIIQEDNSLRSSVNNTDNDQGENQWVKSNKKKKKRKYDQTQKLPTHENCPSETTCADESNATVKQNVNTSSRQERKDGYLNTRGNHQNPVKVIIAGDSMVKHINGYKMSKSNTRVQVSTFPGCTTLDMDDYIKPVLRKKPDKLILHVGTNSLKGRENSTHCAEEIVSLGEKIKRSIPETELIVSGLVTRLDDDMLTRKVNEVNAALKESCVQKHWKFIDHTNITINQLNQSRIHLNKTGSSMMARNFTNYIYDRNC